MAAAADGGERGRSWYLSKEEIERGSPSRRDGVGAAKEAQLRATYCSFIRDVGLRLKLPQITIATGMVLCHRFYLHQSHAKNEWQTVATSCIFLASKIEDTPCPLERVVIAGHETMYKKNPVAARRINQTGILEKRKSLILLGEALLLSTIRYDFNIQHPYEPLKVALKNLGISHKEVKQSAISFINDTLRTTLVVQLKPHYIAAGSLSLAARFHNVRLPTEKGQVWWQQFDIAPKLLEAAIQQMKELFMKRNPLPTSPAIQPTPAQTPVEKQQTLSKTPAIRPIPAQTPVEKQPQLKAEETNQAEREILAAEGLQQLGEGVVMSTISTSPAIRPIPAQTLMEKQRTISRAPVIRPIPAQDPVEKQQTISTTPAIGSVPAQDLAEKQQRRSTTPAIRPIPAQTMVEKQQTISSAPAIRSVPAQDLVKKQQTRSTSPAIRPIPAQTPVEKQQTVSTTPAIQSTSAQPPVEKQQIISFPKPVLKYTYSRRGLKRPAPAPIPSSTLEKKQIISTVTTTESSVRGTMPIRAPVKKQKIRSTPDSVLGRTESSVRGTMPIRAPARARTPVRKHQKIRTPVRKQQIISTQVPVLRHTQPSVGGERRSTTAPASSPARKQKIISTPDSVLTDTNPSVGGGIKPTAAPARARSPVRKPHTHPSAGSERSSTAPARSLVRKEQIISTPGSALRHRNPSVGGEGKPTAAPAPAPARASSPVRKLHTHPSAGGERRSSTAPARSPVRKEQRISTPDSVLRHTNPSVGGERKPTTDPAPARARSPPRKPHTHPSAGGERRSATAPAKSPVRKEQIISTPDSVLRPTDPSQRGLTINDFDRHASRCSMRVDSSVHRDSTDSLARNEDIKPQRMHVDTSNDFDRHASRRMRVDSSVHRDSTDSSARNEDSKPQRMHVDHSLNKIAKDGPDSALRPTNPSQRGLTSNDFDRHASKRMRVDSSVHRDSTDSSARNEDSKPQRMHVDTSNDFDGHASRHMHVDSSVRRDSTDRSARNEDSKPQRMHVDHSLNKVAKDGRPEVLTLREALRADHVYHVRSEPKDVNMMRVANSVSKKRKIQEAGEHPALVNEPDGDAWTRPKIRSVIVAPPSWKKQKI